MFWIGLIIGLIVGAGLGVILMALFVTAHNVDNNITVKHLDKHDK